MRNKKEKMLKRIVSACLVLMLAVTSVQALPVNALTADSEVATESTDVNDNGLQEDVENVDETVANDAVEQSESSEQMSESEEQSVEADATQDAPTELSEDAMNEPETIVDEQSVNDDENVVATYASGQLYAILYDSGELHFQYGDAADSSKGSVKAKYQVADSYSASYYVPWDNNRTLIIKVTSDNIVCPSSTAYWFDNCSSLTSLDVSNFNTSKVTDMNFMFYGCRGLTSLNVSHFDTTNATSMNYMFSGCSSLTSLDVSNFNTSNVTSIYSMFSGCKGLTSLDVSNFNTSKVTSMSSMFSGCSSLTSLDVSNFNTSKVTSMSSMFSGCSSLTSLDVSNFDTSKVTSTYGMFSGCSSLTSLDVSNFNTANVTNMYSMFYRCNNLTSLDVSNFNTANVTTMSSMFYECNNLTSLDVSNFNTANVTNMSSMFSWCDELTSLDVSNFDTSKVTNMDTMFGYCYALTSIDVSKFDTTNVTNMHFMFHNCGLISLNLSNFNTTNVTNMCSMFGDSHNLKSLDISNFDTSKVTRMSSMFYDCYHLISLDVSNFDTTNVTDMADMFGNCSRLQKVILGKNFKFVGTNGYLSTPKSSYFSGATGKWRNTAGKTFAPSEIPNNVADTYIVDTINYQVAFNPNGGTGIMSNQKFAYNTSKALTANTFKRNGYKFTGWNIKSDGSGTSYSDKQSVNNLTDKDGAVVTLYAQWTPITYTIKYDANGGSGSMSNNTITFESGGTVRKNTFTRNGYTFNYWYMSRVNNGKTEWFYGRTDNSWINATSWYELGKNPSGTKLYEVTDGHTFCNSNLISGAVITAHAQWKMSSCVISFDGNGNTTTPVNQTCRATSDTFTLPDSSRTGYIFKGWNTQRNGSGKNYNSNEKLSSKDFIAANGSSVRLYAQWTAIKYTVKFNPNTGSGSMPNQSFTYDENKQLSANTFTKTGYYFTGWNTKSDGTGMGYVDEHWMYQNADKDGDVITLYAQWQPYTVDIAVKKVWDDNNNSRGTRPDSITVQLLQNNKVIDTAILSEDKKDSDGNWYAAFTNLSKYQSDGTTAYQYDIKEIAVTGYKTVITKSEGFTGNGDSDFSENSIEPDNNPFVPQSADIAVQSDADSNVGYTYTVTNTPVDYQVAFNANGGSGTMSNQKFAYNESKALTANTFTRTGYTFNGWNTNANGSGTAYPDKQSIKNLTDKDGAVITLYAQWKVNTYDLTVTHKVSGNMGNKHSDFSFTINLSGMSGNNITAVFTDASGKQTTKTLSMNNGKVAFSLKHGENVVFKNIPYNTSYTITENNADGYAVSSTNASGTITANTTATFTSTRNATVPTSADTNAKAMVIIVGLSIIAAGMLILKRRKTKAE